MRRNRASCCGAPTSNLKIASLLCGPRRLFSFFRVSLSSSTVHRLGLQQQRLIVFIVAPRDATGVIAPRQNCPLFCELSGDVDLVGAAIDDARALRGPSKSIADHGLVGLAPQRRGPKDGHKISAEVLAYVDDLKAATPDLTMPQCVGAIAIRFGVRVHRRRLERATLRQVAENGECGAAVCAARSCNRCRLAARAHPRSSTATSASREPTPSPAMASRNSSAKSHSPSGHRHGPRSLPTGAQLSRLASASRAMRAGRHPYSRRGWRLRPSQLQRPAAARAQRHDE